MIVPDAMVVVDVTVIISAPPSIVRVPLQFG